MTATESDKRVDLLAELEEARAETADLRRRADGYRSLLDFARDMIWRTDQHGLIDYVNASAEELLGTVPEELIGRSIDGCFSPESVLKINEGIGETPAESPASPFFSAEVEYRHKDGRLIPGEVRIWIERDPRGQLVALRGVSRESSERKRAEEALRQTNELFSLFIRHSPIYAYIKEVTPTESRVLHASENYLQMIGIPGSQMVGKTMEELFPADLAAKFTADDWAVVSTGEVLQLDEDLADRNYVSVKFPIVQGDRTLLAGYTIDITERKRTEKALRESEIRFTQLAEQSRTVAWEVDAQGLYTYVSPVSEAVWGYRPDELVGRVHFYELHPQPGREEFKEASLLVFEGKGVFHDLVNGIQTKHGSPAWVSTNGIPLSNADGSLRGYRGSDTDITDRKRAEEASARLEAQLQQAQKMESVGRLAGGVAHDFNNMLGAILGHAELALLNMDPSQQLYSHLVEIQKAALRSAELTRQLLAFARKQTVAPKVLDLNETVAGMLKMLRRLLGEDVRLTWQPTAGLWPVKVDPSQIDRILANLCVNARDAIAGVGEISIETGNCTFDEGYCAAHSGFLPGDYIRFVVSDDGCGMSAETMARLFEPFFTTKSTGMGTGLGLATVYGIVKQNNGFITVGSKEGAGSRFEIYLPRHVGERRQPQQEDALGTARRGRETVLLVEDELSILRITTTMLERQGYFVLSASTPGEAIRLVAEHPGEVHLLMTDVVMPEMNGRDLARNLIARYPRLKCLFMSGYTADVIAQHGVLDERVSFLQKPFAMQEMAAKVREALERE